MILFALNVAIAATFAALVGLMAERLCTRRAIALRHSILFICMTVIAATPLLASFAQIQDIGVLRAWPAVVDAVKTDDSAPLNDKLAAASTVATSSPKFAETDSQLPARNSHPATPILPYAIDVLLAVWACGTLNQLSRLTRSWLLLRGLSCSAEHVAGDIRRIALRASRRLQLRRMPEITWCALAPSPLVMGLLKPRILLPTSVEALPVDELEAVLLHELAHVARHDQWAGLMAAVVQACFWWCLPVTRLLRRLGDLREQLCDALVVGEQGHGLNLAAALLTVCEGAMRGRLPYAHVAALGAAGTSGGALRNRIQTLTNKENHLMIRTTLSTRIAVGALGLLIAGAVTVLNVRPVHASAAIELAALPPTIRMLSEADFWTKTGATAKHGFDAEAVSELEKVVRAGDHPELSLRAAKLLCDHAGHSRSNPKLSDADNALAVRVAFEYVESHLADAEVVKYAPARGFSHMTISEMGNDGEGIAWVLIETAQLPPSFNGGLNIRVDLKASRVTSVKQWGDVRPAPAK